MRNPFIRAEVADGVDLVFHQGDEGGDDDGGAVFDQGRQLVAHRLAAASRHDDKSIFTVEDILYDRFLISLKTVEPENFLQSSV